MTQDFRELAEEIVEFYVGDCSCEEGKQCKSCQLKAEIEVSLSRQYERGKAERYILKAEVDQAWNEAVEACKKVVDGYQIMGADWVHTEIAESISKLRRE